MSESKEQWALVEKVQEFMLSSKLESDFEAFAEEYEHVFRACLNMKPGDEHPVEFYTIYREYLDRFEKKIERFIEGVSHSHSVLLLHCCLKLVVV